MRAPSFRLAFLIFASLVISAGAADAPSGKEEPSEGWKPFGYVKKTLAAVGSRVRKVGEIVGSGITKTVSRTAHALGFPDSKQKKSFSVVKLQVTPPVVNLAENRTVGVLIKVTNTGKRAVLMEFPNAQRADAVLRDAKGQIVARASDDQEVGGEPAVVSLNPGERLEYPITLSTRAMKPGERYRLEASIVHQAGMQAHETVSTK